MQQRRGTAAQWTTANPILAAGEIGFETDNNKFKIGDGVNHWDDLSYFSDAASISALVDGAPALMDTLNEISEALGDDPDFVNTIGQQISTINNSLTYLANIEALEDLALVLDQHSNATANVHGIVNTEALVTDTQLANGLSSLSDDIQSSLDNVANALSDHEALQTSVHGITNTQNLVYTNDSRLTDERIPTNGSVTTAKIVNSAVETAKIANENVTTEKLANNAVTNAKMADDSVDTAEIKDGAVTNAKLAGSIAQSKITDLVSNLSAKLESSTAATTYAPIASPTFTGTVSGVTKSHVGLGNVDNTTDALKPVSTATQTALDAKLALAGGTMTGALTLSGAPSADLHAATKAYVDNVTAGINFHEAVHAASTTNLATNYSNGTSGVGATLTADTNRAFSTLDGESVTLGQRVLIKNQTDAKQNGIYTLTTVGSGSAPWVLTRATDADNNPTGEMKTGDFVFVINGTVNASVGYINNSTANPIVIGTDNISYTEFSAGKTVVAGSGLTEAVPGTLSIATGAITSAMIADEAIVDADVNASAAIAQSKISGLVSDLAAKAPLASPTFTGTVTVAASGIAFTDGTQTAEGVPSRTPIIQKSASYTLSALTERDDLIEMGSGSAMTLTIPTDATLNFPIGTSLDILQTSTGQVTIAGASGVTVNATPGLKLRTQWSSCTLFKRAANTWVAFGDLSA